MSLPPPLQILWLLPALLIGLAGAPLQAAPADHAPGAAPMSTGQAVILGVVEGLTEFLPVSSTGHLLLAQRALGLGQAAQDKEAADAYAVCIQLGAILAVAGLYFRRVREMLLGLMGRCPAGWRLSHNLAVAFVPAAIAGLALEKRIKLYLFGGDRWGLWPVVAAWLAGGLVILWLDRWLVARGRRPAAEGLDSLTWRMALGIGLAQCLAMWPGVSRSLATIVGGLLVGLPLASAVEFSFLL